MKALKQLPGKGDMVDIAVFALPQTWLSLLTLTFLEIVLGVDNLVFISITTDRLPKRQQHLGRKLGLMGALLMRIVFLSFASVLVHLETPLFILRWGFFEHGFSVRDVVLLVGGAYLVYKGIDELHKLLGLAELKAEHKEGGGASTAIALPQAVGTIMVMDIVFSIDSVITAVALVDHLVIMILAVMIAVALMMVFIDRLAKFINTHAEMKILALCFILVIGVLLVLDSAGITSGIEVLDMHVEKLMVYFAMIFSLVLELIQMRYKANVVRAQKTANDSAMHADYSDTFPNRASQQTKVVKPLALRDALPSCEKPALFMVDSCEKIRLPLSKDDEDLLERFAILSRQQNNQTKLRLSIARIDESAQRSSTT